MDRTQIKFFLDENVPAKLKRSFTVRNLKCQMIQELGWSGFKDPQISAQISGKDLVFVTRDKEFAFSWQRRKLRIVFIAVEPAILEKIQPRVEDLLDHWNFDPIRPFLLIVQNESTRFWQEPAGHS